MDLMRFYAWLQDRYFQESRKYLRSIGCQVPVVGSNWSQLSQPGLETIQGMDAVDTHIYYDMPSPQKKTGRYKNKSMYEVYGLNNLQSILASNALTNTPFCISETHWAFPNEYQAQFVPELLAYASLQDWDSVILFYHPNTPLDGIGQTSKAAFMNDFGNNPLVLSQAFLASRAFRNQLIKPARKEVVVHYRTSNHGVRKKSGDRGQTAGNRGKATEQRSLQKKDPDIQDAALGQTFVQDAYLPSLTGRWVTPQIPYPYTVPGREGLYNLPYEIALKHKVSKSFSSVDDRQDGGVYWKEDDRLTPLSTQERVRLQQLQDARAIYSDSGQILSDQEDQILRVETSAFQSITGLLQGLRHTRQKDFRVQAKRPIYASVSALALDGKDISGSENILVSAVGRVRNSQMSWDESRQKVKTWGKGPVLCELVPAQVSIQHSQASEARVLALDGSGRPMREVHSWAKDGMVHFHLDAEHTVWYLVQVASNS
jgi:hypothetical protein